jgi:hypothetical protein
MAVASWRVECNLIDNLPASLLELALFSYVAGFMFPDGFNT